MACLDLDGRFRSLTLSVSTKLARSVSISTITLLPPWEVNLQALQVMNIDIALTTEVSSPLRSQIMSGQHMIKTARDICLAPQRSRDKPPQLAQIMCTNGCLKKYVMRMTTLSASNTRNTTIKYIPVKFTTRATNPLTAYSQ